MRRVKGRTSSKIFEEFLLVKKRYRERHFWTQRYFSVTSGELAKEMIQEYLAHHFEHDSNDNLNVE